MGALWKCVLAAALALTLSCRMAPACEEDGEEAAGEESAAEAEKGGQSTGGTYRWSLEVKYPRIGAEAVDKDIRGWFRSVIPSAGEDAAEFAEFDLDAVGLEEGGWEMIIDHEITRPSPRAVSIRFDIHTFPFGAAHPSGQVEVLNYDLETGRRLTIYDLFRNADKALEIMAANAPALVAEDFKGEFAETIEDDDWFKDGFTPTPDNYSALVLEPEGVRVVFQQYQILPYVFGMRTALFPLSLLEPAMPNKDIWAVEKKDAAKE